MKKEFMVCAFSGIKKKLKEKTKGL